MFKILFFLFKGLWAHPPAPTVCDEGDPPQHPW